MPNILTNTGRAALVAGLKAQTIMLALGVGDGSWTTPPMPDVDASELIGEIGRKIATRTLFVSQDLDGGLVIPTGINDSEGNMIYERYAVNETPTRSLYMEFKTGFEDASNQTIRELGVFIGTELKEGLPPGQTFFTAEDITKPGILYLLENIVPSFREPTRRETYEIVLTI